MYYVRSCLGGYERHEISSWGRTGCTSVCSRKSKSDRGGNLPCMWSYSPAHTILVTLTTVCLPFAIYPSPCCPAAPAQRVCRSLFSTDRSKR
ncbi:hypothetical protein LZ31DRAFT_381853 [Colletotrichum somersetense]|nr:hypothetical protein LZ31DRAFT_381853 [Colletotrichum somersetense]